MTDTTAASDPAVIGARMIEQQESPNFDPVGSARDSAFSALPGIQERLNRDIPQRGQRVIVQSGKRAGAEGAVFWIGEKRGQEYKRKSWALVDHLRTVHSFRLGIMTDEGEKIFVDADRVRIQVAR
jgi:hypothetical protein